MALEVLVVQMLWFVAPAYAANGFPPLMQGRRPLDFGKKFRGKRVFGSGKTFEGTITGIIVGVLAGILQVAFQQQLTYLNLNLPVMTLPLAVALSTGTFAGDLFGSFVKRQMGIARGKSAPLLDQDGFLVFAFLAALLVYPLDPLIAAAALIITPPIHWFTNIIGYQMKFKKNPW